MKLEDEENDDERRGSSRLQLANARNFAFATAAAAAAAFVVLLRFAIVFVTFSLSL